MNRNFACNIFDKGASFSYDKGTVILMRILLRGLVFRHTHNHYICHRLFSRNFPPYHRHLYQKDISVAEGDMHHIHYHLYIVYCLTPATHGKYAVVIATMYFE